MKIMITDNYVAEKIAIKNLKGVSVLTLKQTIQSEEAEALELAFEALSKTDSLHIIVDMTKVEYICSSALGILVSYKQNLEKFHGDVKLVFRSENLTRLFEVAMLDRVFEIYLTLQEALDVYPNAKH